MDILVRWEDGTTNVVSSKELKIGRYKRFRKGSDVKMKYKSKWYKGTILAVEQDESIDSESECDLEDNIPLSKLKTSENAGGKAAVSNEAASKTCMVRFNKKMSSMWFTVGVKHHEETRTGRATPFQEVMDC